MVLRMALRMGEHLGPAREKIGVRLAGPHPKRMTAARNRVLAVLADGMVRAKSELRTRLASRPAWSMDCRRRRARNGDPAARAGGQATRP